MLTPPRRRRPPDRNAKSDGGGWLPTILMGLGVIVAGLGIGALVAVFMQRGPAKLSPVATLSAAPTAQPTPSRTPLQRPVALLTLRPERSLEPSPPAAPSPSLAPSPSATPAPSPSARPGPTAKPSSRPTVAPVHVATAAPARVAVVTPAPRISQTPIQTESPAVAAATPTVTALVPPVTSTVPPVARTVPPVASAVPPSQSAYDDHAAGIVRRYVEALIRGDQKAAYTALGGGGTLSELAFIDARARIVAVKVTRIDAANASVGCEIAAAKGHYYATYHVTAATSGPYISEHDYIKVSS